jgi:type II secretory pathway component PulK
MKPTHLPVSQTPVSEGTPEDPDFLVKHTADPGLRGVVCEEIEQSLSHRRLRHRGVVLIVALIITAVLATMVLALGRSMRVELQASSNEAASAQAQSVERAAEQYVMGLFTTDPMNVQNLSEDQFQIHVGAQGTGGTFLIVRPNYDDQSLPLYGLVDEGSKININNAPQSMLYNLVQDDDTLSAIQQWRTANGVDSYYNSLPNPYQCKGAPLESVEELLMVRGITREIMYGNGTASPLGERTNVLTNTSANAVLSDSQLSRGIFDLLTIWSGTSYEPTTLPDGSQRYRLDRMGQLQQLLNNYLQDRGRAQEILRRFNNNNLPTNIFDLAARGRMTSQEVDEIVDYVRAPTNGVQARIDVNQAPPSVLYTLVRNSIPQTTIDQLLAARQQNAPPAGAFGWVMDAVGVQQARALAPFITNRGFLYSADIHAYSDDGRAFKRVRIIVDARTAVPEIAYRRDITDRPDPMDQQNIDSLRKGQGLAIGTTSAFSARGGIQ